MNQKEKRQCARKMKWSIVKEEKKNEKNEIKWKQNQMQMQRNIRVSVASRCVKLHKSVQKSLLFFMFECNKFRWKRCNNTNDVFNSEIVMMNWLLWGRLPIEFYTNFVCETIKNRLENVSKAMDAKRVNGTTKKTLDSWLFPRLET